MEGRRNIHNYDIFKRFMRGNAWSVAGLEKKGGNATSCTCPGKFHFNVVAQYTDVKIVGTRNKTKVWNDEDGKCFFVKNICLYRFRV